MDQWAGGDPWMEALKGRWIDGWGDGSSDRRAVAIDQAMDGAMK